MRSATLVRNSPANASTRLDRNTIDACGQCDEVNMLGQAGKRVANLRMSISTFFFRLRFVNILKMDKVELSYFLTPAAFDL